MDEVRVTGDPPCEVCRFQRDTVERRYSLIARGSVTDSAFLARFIAGGGYCARHLRRVVVRGEADRYAVAAEPVIRDVVAQLATGALRGLKKVCPACDIDAWAESHALWVLASGQASIAGGTGRLTPSASVCLRHAGLALHDADDAAAPGPSVIGRLQRALGEAREAGSLHLRLAVVAGADPDADLRRRDSPGTGWPGIGAGADPRRAAAGLREMGACPACSAAERSLRTSLSREESPESWGPTALCHHHAWAALQADPGLAEAGVAWSVERWSARVRELVSDSPQSGRSSSGPRLVPGLSALRSLRAGPRRREDPTEQSTCTACDAAARAITDALRQVAAELAAGASTTTGLCISHLRSGMDVLGRACTPALADAEARGRSVLSDLVCWLDQPEPETRAQAPGHHSAVWVPAFVFLAGDSVVAEPWWLPPAASPRGAM